MDTTHAPRHDDRAPQASDAVRLLAAMTEHPRSPGVLWEAIGWNRERAANLRDDEARGACKRDWDGRDASEAA